jgi:hypothetical protein
MNLRCRASSASLFPHGGQSISPSEMGIGTSSLCVSVDCRPPTASVYWWRQRKLDIQFLQYKMLRKERHNASPISGQARQRLETASGWFHHGCGMPRGPAFAHGPPRQEVLPDNCMTPQPASIAFALPAQTWLRSNAITNACFLNSLSLPAIVPRGPTILRRNSAHQSTSSRSDHPIRAGLVR